MKYTIKDNLFKSVNAEWLEKTQIPSDRSSIGEFVELDINNEIIIKKLAKSLLKKQTQGLLKEANLINFTKFYSLTSDFESRNKNNIEPLKKYVFEILDIKDLEQLNQIYTKFIYRNYLLPFNFDVSNDFLDSSIKTLYLTIASHILPDKSHYDDKQKTTMFYKEFKSMVKKLLLPYFNDVKKVDLIIKQTLEFDQIIAKYSLTSLEKVRYNELYKPYDYDKIVLQTKYFDLNNIIKTLINQPVDKVIFTDDNFANNLDQIFNTKNLELIKSWLIVMLVVRFSKYLDEKTRILASKYSLFISGQSKVKDKNKHALNLALEYFSMPIGLYYGQKYLGSKAKKDVEQMVLHMIQIYKNRLESNTWLSKDTIKKALLKLDTLGVHIGYPSEIEPYYTDLVSNSNSLIETVFSFNEVINKYVFSEYKKPINKNYWSMAPYQVNAYYHPMYNHIVFPAGILQGSFYSINHSTSQNYGGIGAVIAHEISHAFDNNGANFDENGNLKMWWTQEDFEKFKQKTQKMIDLFDGREIEYGKCNGALTVSENIADAGGISCALQAAQLEKDYDAKEFFINWARIWKSKYKQQTALRLLETDPHAPTELRANIQAANHEEFIKAFDIQPEDKMYISKEKRVKIW
ncbi:Neutral endopeptidase [Mycoplasma feriruminatoris]|uniref:M13 family metallopeptidase n=1 Tax=Mycoplasma feriruminatoris TaxID=1179777 RepID=UPI00241E8FFD|nr:M13-type metalloendopeptidase [Mycoplasma feriruminatoris]WFQ91815.1 Neutral endopeptidase [Mycoplasma feriruminatoris]